MNPVSNFFSLYKENVFKSNTWKLIKLLWIIGFLFEVSVVLFKSFSIKLNLGLCNFLPCQFFLNNNIKIILVIISVVFGVLYFFEYKMKVTTLVLSIISLLVFTVADSTGVFYRNEGFSLIMIGQFIAYYVYNKKKSGYKINELRIKISMLTITMLYFFSFVSKITTSGLLWFTQTKGFANHVLKSKMYEYATTGNTGTLMLGQNYYNFIVDHPIVIGVLLLGALLLEGFAFLSNFNYKIAFFWGIGLIGMHIGIYFLMDIFIISIILSMLLFIFNLPAVIISLKELIFSKNDTEF